MVRADLDRVRLLAKMREEQRALVAITDGAAASRMRAAPVPIDAFLAGLRVAWRTGEVRPKAQRKPKQKRGRRRTDPLAAVSDELQAWFEADPSRSSGELLARLQTTYPDCYPDCYPDALLRTVQRRIKGWRSAMASELVLGIERHDGCPETHSGTLS